MTDTPSKTKAVREVKSFVSGLKGIIAWAEQLDEVDKLERAAEAAAERVAALEVRAAAIQGTLAAAEEQAKSIVEQGTAEAARIVDEASAAAAAVLRDADAAKARAAENVKQAAVEADVIRREAHNRATAMMAAGKDEAAKLAAQRQAVDDAAVAKIAELDAEIATKQQALSRLNADVAKAEARQTQVQAQIAAITKGLGQLSGN